MARIDEIAARRAKLAAGAEPTAEPVSRVDRIAARRQEIDAERDQQLHNTLGSVLPPMSLGEGADRDAAAIRLAEQTGAPLDTVRRNFDVLQGAWQRNQFDPRKFRQEQPALADLVLSRPELAPAIAKDLSLTTTAAGLFWKAIGGIGSGSASVIRGVGTASQIIDEHTTTPLSNAILGTDARSPNFLDPLADLVAADAEKVRTTRVAPEAQAAAAGFNPSGDPLDPATWTLGPNPTIAGVALQGADVFGAMLPIVVGSLAGGGPATALGFLQSGGSGAEQARETIERMAKTPVSLEAGAPMQITESPLYRELRARGLSHEDATRRTADAAEQWAFALTAPVGAAGGAATSRILSPATRVLAGRGIAAQVAGRVGLGALEEGSQEAAEGIASALGTEQGAGVDVDATADVLGNFVLGAIAGGGTGGLGSLGVVQQERAQRKAAAILEAFTTSALAKASPASFAQVIEQETARSGEAVTALHFDAEATLRLFQEHSTAPEDVLGEDGAKRLQDAVLTGEKFAVPVADLGPLAAHPAAAQLAAEHVATRPGHQTTAEAKANRETDTARRAELVALYESQDAPPMTPAEARIVEGLQAQLAGTRVTSAKQAETSVAQLRAFVQTMAERFGKTPDELFAQRITAGRASAAQPAAAVAQGGEAPRGWMERAGNAFRISLTRKADLSTFLHESGHVLLELHGDLAGRVDAPQSVRDDYAALLSWLGVESREGIQREHHEKFARGYEAYLREGNAPSEKLRRAFETFRIWLTRVYRDVRALNVDITDDVRGVFDRMLATDEEIAKARAKAGISPRVTKPDWMTPEEWAAYEASVDRAAAAESKRAQLRALEERKREQDSWWREELRAEIAKAEEEYDGLKETRDWRFLRYSETLGVKADPLVRLDRAEAEAIIGKDAAKRLHGVLVKKGGQRLQDVADELGWASGRDMLETLLAHPDKATWAKRAADERMREKHGDLLRDRQELAQMIHEAQHSGEGFSDAMLIEWVAVTSKAGGSTASIEAIKGAARDIAQGKRVQDVSAARVLADERRAAERFALAVARKDWEAAKKYGRERLINHHLYAEMVKAERARERFEQMASDLNDNKRRARVGLASPQLRDMTDGLLVALGLRPSDPEIPPFGGVGALAEMLTGSGVPPVFAQEEMTRILHALPAATKTRAGWEKLTVADLAVVDTALQQMKKAGVALSEIAVEERRRGHQELALLIAEEASIREDLGLSPQDESVDLEDREATLRRQGLVSGYERIEFIFERLGPTAHALFRRFLQGLTFAKELADLVLVDVTKAWDSMPKAMQEQRYDTLDATSLPVAQRTRRDNGPVTREWMWALFLNWGNDGNRQRLLDGYGWTEQQVQDFIERHMTREEAAFLQGILDATDKLRPYMERTYEAVHGVKPGRVVATPITLRFADGTSGTFRGGYYPVRLDQQARDPSSGMRAAAQADAGIQDARASAAASLAQGFTKSRAVRFNGVISLDWNVVPAHLTQVIHYAAFEEFVRDFNRLLLNDTFLETIERRLGRPYIARLKEWIKSVAANRDESVAGYSSEFLGGLARLKSFFTAATLAFNVKSWAGDILGLATPVLNKEISARSMSAALRKASSPRGFMQMRREAMGVSKALPMRSEHLRDTLRHHLQEIGRGGLRKQPGGKGIKKALRRAWAPTRAEQFVRDNSFIIQETLDVYISTVMWWAAREDAKRSAEEQKAKKALVEKDPNRLEQSAVDPELTDAEQRRIDEAADDVLRVMQPPATMLEQPAILRDRKGIGALLAFFGFWAQMGNIGLRGVRLGETRADRMAAFGRWYATMLLINTFGSLLSGSGPEDDEGWAEWSTRKALTAPLIPVPLFAPVFEAGINAAVARAFQGEWKHRRFSFMTSPALATAERLLNSISDASKAEEPVPAVVALLEGVGTARGLPVTQAKRTGGAAWDLLTGETEARDILDAVDKLLYGDRDDQPASIIGAGREAVTGER